ncbi:MAG: hypothetical protein AB1797_10075 [bacterium]
MEIRGLRSQTVSNSQTELLGIQEQILKRANEIPKEVVLELVNNVNAVYEGVGRNIDRLA